MLLGLLPPPRLAEALLGPQTLESTPLPAPPVLRSSKIQYTVVVVYRRILQHNLCFMLPEPLGPPHDIRGRRSASRDTMHAYLTGAKANLDGERSMGELQLPTSTVVNAWWS